jgi:hypothetical protein
VQVQKLKLDTESAMLEMDQVSSVAAWVQLLSFVLSPGPVAPSTAAAMLVLCSDSGLTHGGTLDFLQLLKANELNLALIAAIPAFVVRH